MRMLVTLDLQGIKFTRTQFRLNGLFDPDFSLDTA